jgi:preprotein translocase subunit SecD
MRALILALAFSCTTALAAEKKPTLAFYVVSPKKIEGGRFIDTKEFPKLGYIPAKSGLGITELSMVALTKRPGDRSPILITLKQEQVEQLANFTGRNVGRKILLMLGNEPLIAPRILEKIRTPALQISVSDEKKQKQILQKLMQLVKINH